MKRFNWLLTGALLVSTFAGCKKKQEMAERTPVWTADEKARVETVINQQLPFQTFQSKMNISLQGGSKSFAVNGTFKLIRNERLQVSIQPFLGIEVVRAEFTNDSLKLMDRLNKRYVAESIVSYREKLPVDVRFETIQALFLNQLFVPGEPTFSINDFTAFRWRTENDGLLVGRLKNDDWFVLNFFLNPENMLSQTQVSSKSGAHIVDWRYERFQPLSGISFPMKSIMTYRTSNDQKLKAELEFSRVELDKKINMRFDIPASYSKIELSDLVRGLMKLP